MPQSNSHILIIGCGKLGASVASSLSARGLGVVIIDRDSESFDKLSPDFGGIIINDNAEDLHALQEAKIKKAAAVICVTGSDNTNILLAVMAKRLYAVPRVIVRIYAEGKGVVLDDLGVEIISPQSLAAARVRSLLSIEIEGAAKL
jgi:trk system potassium uptake protein TrkA